MASFYILNPEEQMFGLRPTSDQRTILLMIGLSFKYGGREFDRRKNRRETAEVAR